MFGDKSRFWIAIIFISLMVVPFALSLEASEVYDINDRQTKDLKSFINVKIEDAKTEMGKITEGLVKTFDTRMAQLSKSFAIQSAIMMFFAILLGNSISILLRQKHEKKLMEFRYNELLAKEIEIRQREWQQAQPRPQPQEQARPQAQQVDPMPMPPTPKPQKKGIFQMFSRKKKIDDDLNKAMKGVY